MKSFTLCAILVVLILLMSEACFAKGMFGIVNTGLNKEFNCGFWSAANGKVQCVSQEWQFGACDKRTFQGNVIEDCSLYVRFRLKNETSNTLFLSPEVRMKNRNGFEIEQYGSGSQTATLLPQQEQEFTVTTSGSKKEALETETIGIRLGIKVVDNAVAVPVNPPENHSTVEERMSWSVPR